MVSVKVVDIAIVIMIMSLLISSCNGVAIPEAGESDNDDLPDYMKDWDLMEPVFDPLSEELGTYVINWDWKQENADGVVYYLEEAATQDFLNPNITTHQEPKVLKTGIPNGTYWYRVRAVKGNLTSVWSQPDMVRISVEPIDMEPPVIIHDYHKDAYNRLFKGETYYQKEKLEFFLKVPMLVQVGDAENAPRYWMTLHECHTSDYYNVSIIEIQEPHQFLIVTSDKSTIDIDMDGVDDLEVQFKSQHEYGQVYITFKFIDNSSPVVSYTILAVIVAFVVAFVYLVYRRRSGTAIRKNNPVGDGDIDNGSNIDYITEEKEGVE